MCKQSNSEFNWDDIEEKLWNKLEKKWPYFWTDDITSLEIFVEQEYLEIPKKLSESQFMVILNRYVDSQILSLSPLMDTNPKLKREFDIFDKYLSLSLEWYVGRGKKCFVWNWDLMIDSITEELLDELNSSFVNCDFDEVLILSFYDQQEAKKRINELLSEEVEKFQNKWRPYLEKEKKKALEALSDALKETTLN